MKVVNGIQNVLLLVVAVGVVFVALGGILQMNSEEVVGRNPAIDVIQKGGEIARFDVLETVFVDQTPLESMILSIVAYVLIAVVIVALFWAIRATVRAVRAKEEE